MISLEVIDENEYSEDYSEDDSEDDRLIERRRTTENSFFKITFNLYRNRLDLFELISNNNNILQVYSNFIDYLFFKAIYLKKDFVVFAYIAYISEISEDFSLVFKLYELNYLYGGNQRARKIIHIEIDNEILIDFIKISDRRLAFICTNCFFDDAPSPFTPLNRFLQTDISFLYILIIDIRPDFEELIPKFKSYFIGGYIPTFQISGFIYNDFLLFTSTAIRFEDYYNFNDDNYLSIFMIFGYTNGTDSIIDISEILYLEAESNEWDNSFYDFLLQYLTIENNIFNYVPAGVIKLISIPEELIIIKEDDFDYPLQNNSEIYKILYYKIL